MGLPHFRFLFLVLVTAIGLIGITTFNLKPPRYEQSPKETTFGSAVSSVLSSLPKPFAKPAASPKHAFVAFLEDFSGANKAEDEGEEDAYYTGNFLSNPTRGSSADPFLFLATRVLGYQLMHAPSTRSTKSLPFIVVCSEVSERKRRRLEKDGAIVVEVEKIPDPEWLKTRQQWQGVMTKLRVFQQEQYEKLLFIDADMLIVRPLDDIFEDNGTMIAPPVSNLTGEVDEAALPSSYMLAGQAQQGSREHPYPPPPDEDWFCSGFFVFKPSQTIFDHYMSIVNIEGRFDPFYPDQNLLNYAHRWDGPMPWTKFNYTWTTTFPTIKEYNMGAASLHEKYWLEQFRVEEFGQNILGNMWLNAKVEMIDFYTRRDAQ